ncbi:MAG: GFA family protein [Pseudomonadota bacterium]
MIIEGGCYCGRIRYRIEGAARKALQCHCRECQYISGGHPNVTMSFAAGDVKFTRGTPKSFARQDVPQPMTRLFCADCGTHLGTRSPRRPDGINIKVGTLDDPDVYRPQIAIHIDDRQPFHQIGDDVERFRRWPA